MRKLLLLFSLLTIGLKGYTQKAELEVDIIRHLVKGVTLIGKHKCNFDTIKIIVTVNSEKHTIKDINVFSSDEGYKQQYESFFKESNNKHQKQFQTSLSKLLNNNYPTVEYVNFMVYAFNMPGYDNCDVIVSIRDLQNIIRKISFERKQNELSFIPIITTIGPSVIE